MISSAGLLVVLFVDVVACIEGAFKEKPESTTIVTGEKASLNCNTNFADRVVWYHNSSATKISDNWKILLSDDGDKRDRYSVCCDAITDDTHTLEITDFQPIDAGLYSCMILPEDDDIFKSASAVLSIDPPGEMTPPDYASPSCDVIRINRNNDELLDVGDDIVFRCQSQGGNPLPQLTVIDDEEITDIEKVLDGENNIVNYSVSLSTSHINSSFTCKLVSAALDTPRYCSLKPLILGVVILPPQITVVEGTDIVFDCYSKGAESPTFTWQWHMNNNSVNCNSSKGNEEIISNSHYRITIKDVSLALNGCQLFCTVDDLGSQAADNVTLYIQLNTSPTRITSLKLVPTGSRSIVIGTVLGLLVVMGLIIGIVFLKRKSYENIANNKKPSPRETEIPEMAQCLSLSNEQAILCRPTGVPTEADYGKDSNGVSTHEPDTQVHSNYNADGGFNNQSKSLPDETCYHNVQASNITHEENNTENENNVKSLNYAELDLEASISSIHDNEPHTVYSHVILD